MSQPDESDDKQYEPTQKKLEDARKKGDFPRSSDLNTAVGYAGFSIAAIFLGKISLTDLAAHLAGILENADQLSSDLFDGGNQEIIGGITGRVIWTMLPWFVVPAICVVLTIVLQRSLVFAPSKIQPKLSRISLIANAKNKFGRQGWFEFLKSFVKLLIFSGFLGQFLVWKTPEIVATVNLGAALVTSVIFGLSIQFILIILSVATAVGVVDFMWQQAEHFRKNRMSRQEIMDESKQMEGDPHVKQQRRQKAQEIALNKMLSDVPQADVIIVNPTHFAIALKWKKDADAAPICVAKGVDEIAARIREIAHESAIPVHRDAATARKLFAVLEVGDQIWPEHYRAVAAAIRFAENMRKKAPKGAWR